MESRILLSCSSWIFFGAILISAILFYRVDAQVSCTGGYPANGHCYQLYKVNTNWNNATRYCTDTYGGRLVSIYSSTEQNDVAQYLKDENVANNEVWTGGMKPDPEIFWGSPEALWRRVEKCEGDCRKTACSGGSLDIAFIIDKSGSMADNNGWSLTIEFFKSLLSKLDLGDDMVRIALVLYSNKEDPFDAKLVKSLIDNKVGNDYGSISRKLADIRNTVIPWGETSTDAILDFTRRYVFTKERGNRFWAPNVVILLTDGDSTDRIKTTIEAEKLKDSGVQMFVVGVTPQVIIREIHDISSPPQSEGATYFVVEDYTYLDAAVNSVAIQLCKWHLMLNMVGFPAISAQGCFENRTDSGLTTWRDIDVTHPAVCLAQCKLEGWLFAGVGFYSPPNGGVLRPSCMCGNEFGHGGPKDQCTMPCDPFKDPNTVLCGGINRYFVYKTNGLYGYWIYGEPSNYNTDTTRTDGFQFCGAVDSKDVDVYTYSDESCTAKYNFLCELVMGYCNGALAKDSGFAYFNVTVNSEETSPLACVSMGIRMNNRKSWYSARRYCQDTSGGDLLIIRSESMNIDLTAQIKAHKGNPSEQYYWVGLYKNSHFWMDDKEVSEVYWNNFHDNEPLFSKGDCVYVDPTRQYQWGVDDCAANKYYMCAKVISSVTTDNTTNNGNLAAPTAAASTNLQTFVEQYWWLILLLCLLVLLILILIIVFCCYKRERPVKVAPKIYDARPIADVPIGTVLGDDDPYNYFVESNSQVDLVVGSTLHGVPKRKRWNRTISSATGYDTHFDDVRHSRHSRYNGRIEIAD